MTEKSLLTKASDRHVAYPPQLPEWSAALGGTAALVGGTKLRIEDSKGSC